MQVDSIIINENPRRQNLFPFTVLHPSWEARIGAFRIFEKLEKIFPGAGIIYNGQELHKKSFLKRFGINESDIKKENILIYNAETAPFKSMFEKFNEEYKKHIAENPEQKSVLFTRAAGGAFPGEPLAAYLSEEDVINPIDFDKEFLPRIMAQFYDVLPKIEISGAEVMHYLWEAIEFNPKMLMEDKEFFSNEYDFEKAENQGAHFVNKENIVIGKGSAVAPGAVLDASEGPVMIGSGVKIMPNAVLIGPCSIGDNSIIKIGAKIYEDTSIGEWCKVGGEVEATIIQAYSNKQHEGFLGHSYLGEWVNLGADTNNSDLKNTYGNIKVMLNGMEIDTETMFLGLLCGDHTKSAINTSFTTGTIAGVAGILVHDGFLPREIPSFAWTGRKNSPIYKLNKALDVAKKVMARRGKELLPEEEELLTEEHRRAEALKSRP